jgi:citrate lyase gamma subunit
MTVFPVKFEAYKDGEPVFKVEAFDESTASVSIDSLVNVELWEEIAQKVRECLVSMNLK